MEAKKVFIATINSKRKVTEELANQPKKKRNSAEANSCQKLIVVDSSEIPLGHSTPDKSLEQQVPKDIVPLEQEAPMTNEK